MSLQRSLSCHARESGHSVITETAIWHRCAISIPRRLLDRPLSRMMTTDPAGAVPSPLAVRNNWQQQIRCLVAAGMDGIGADVVVGVVVHVVRAADSVAGLHVESDAVALLEYHRCRPNLHLHLDDLAGLKIKPPL